MDLMQAMRISSTGLSAHRQKINIIAENLANTETTRTEEGGPYKRKMVVYEEKPMSSFKDVMNKASSKHSGVDVAEVVESDSVRLVYMPNHPDADEAGYVKMPDISYLTEIADMIVARRAYDANVTAMSNTKSMILKALEIGK
ncbi:MAG: flagellar basal body rod protein FlgC [Desulfobacterales bacterium]|nr:flagellar basal body rod protein FlgC [Desulfobacterales bacterium]